MSTVDVGPGWGPAGNGFALGQAICTTILPIVGLSMPEIARSQGARPQGAALPRTAHQRRLVAEDQDADVDEQVEDYAGH